MRPLTFLKTPAQNAEQKIFRVLLFAVLPIMTILPIVQLILLSYAADNEVKNVNLDILDQDHSVYSKQLIEKIRISDRFNIIEISSSMERADQLMQDGDVDIFDYNFLITKIDFY